MLLHVVLCKYSKFRIESSSYFSIRFNLKRAQLFQIFEYLPSPISYLFNRMMPSNQQHQQTLWPTKYRNSYNRNHNSLDSWIVQCHKNKLNLFNKYWLLVTFEAYSNYSIWFEMKKHYSHSTSYVAVKATYIRLLHGKIAFFGFFGPSSVKRGQTHIVLRWNM